MPTALRTAACSASTPAAGVLQRHRPAAERGELGPGGDVPLVQRRGQQLLATSGMVLSRVPLSVANLPQADARRLRLFTPTTRRRRTRPTRRCPPAAATLASRHSSAIASTYSSSDSRVDGVREVPDASRPGVREAFRHVGRARWPPSVRRQAGGRQPAYLARGRRRAADRRRRHGARSTRPRRTCDAPPGAGVRQAACMARAARSRSRSRSGPRARTRRAPSPRGRCSAATASPRQHDPDRGGTIAPITVVHAAGQSRRSRGSAGPSTLARAVVPARDWVNMPANLLYPESFADLAAGPGEGHHGRGRRPRREGTEPRWLRRHCSRSAADLPGRRGWCGSATAPRAPRCTWRWSARASRSTPAG